ncbi:MAG: excinuclease ABC subunit UvrA [bacterium]|nr:excinuclease ABC subunit UvrA [bacterium]MDZ4286143.1 excinuclease ABC subunit UvrA [Candidatus Sungbacteria bacterium]
MAKKIDNAETIRIRGARVHNLKNVSLSIPKNKLVVITGLSGSGKSSLAFDTIYAEAERRFVESLSSYARQFLGIKEKPDVDAIDGLSPAISIDQKSISKNPRSTVGTITEIYDYLRILYSRIGIPHCSNCKKPIGRQTVDEMISAVMKLSKTKEIVILGPLIRDKKGEHHNVLDELKQAGFLRARVDGAVMTLDEARKLSLDKYKKHSIEVVVDRFTLGDDIDRSRMRDSIETALKIGKSVMMIGQGDNVSLFSEKFACADDGTNIADIEPRTFSFNSPYGACTSCTGLGSTLEVDAELVIPNKRLSIAEGAIRPWAAASHRVGRQSWYWWILDDVATRYKFSLNTPVEKLSPAIIDVLLNGEQPESDEETATEGRREGSFEGVIPNLKRRWKETDSDFTRAEIEKYMMIRVCPVCNGKRLKPEALAVTINTYSIADIADMTVTHGLAFFAELLSKRGKLTASQMMVANPLAKEITKRLSFLSDVGLEYLTVARESTSLSGGEAQRIQLATQIGSQLTGIIYILDEPSIGLHPRDNRRLIDTLKTLRDLGNTVIVVEHDAETMQEADWIIDLGPGAGTHGGKIIFEGTPAELLKSPTSTGLYLSGKKQIKIKPRTLRSEKLELVIKGAAEHNLKSIDVTIPLGLFVCVTGVSGSGKSSLVNDILAKSLLAQFYGAHSIPGKHNEITGTEHINKAIVVDQSPIGRTPRSNPATYTGVFGIIRSLFSATPDARSRGYLPGRFSFNVKGGRCEACEGQGVKKIEMYFLPDVYVECEECRGRRYNHEALEIEFNGRNIAQVLDMSIEEALRFFEAIPAITIKLETLKDVGLDYLKLGQPAPTLSGGEAQRVKLATELSRRDTGRTLYILDEPTTGLHFDDIQKLMNVLSALVEKGNTVLVIEHNTDVVRNADWIIDLGPEGGDKGGMIVAVGSPAEIAKNKKSYTGKWLTK